VRGGWLAIGWRLAGGWLAAGWRQIVIQPIGMAVFWAIGWRSAGDRLAIGWRLAGVFVLTDMLAGE
jgi:hypothetical protein